MKSFSLVLISAALAIPTQYGMNSESSALIQKRSPKAKDVKKEKGKSGKGPKVPKGAYGAAAADADCPEEDAKPVIEEPTVEPPVDAYEPASEPSGSAEDVLPVAPAPECTEDAVSPVVEPPADVYEPAAEPSGAAEDVLPTSETPADVYEPAAEPSGAAEEPILNPPTDVYGASEPLPSGDVTLPVIDEPLADASVEPQYDDVLASNAKSTIASLGLFALAALAL